MGLDAGFVSLLSMRMTWEANDGQDQWGNESYATPVLAVPCFVTSQASDFGGDDGQNKSEGPTVTRVEVLTDAVGINVKDKLTLPNGKIVFVTNVDTPQDESGADLMHTITAETAQKG